MSFEETAMIIANSTLDRPNRLISVANKAELE